MEYSTGQIGLVLSSTIPPPISISSTPPIAPANILDLPELEAESVTTIYLGANANNASDS